MRSWMLKGSLAAVLLMGLIAPAFAATGWLGLITQPIDADLRQGLDLTRDGVLINAVSDASPAAKAGFKKGDVLLTLDGQPVLDPEQLRERVRAMVPGRTVKAEVWRDAATRTLDVTIGDLPSGADAPPAGDGKQVRILMNGREVSPESLRDLHIQGLEGLLDGDSMRTRESSDDDRGGDRERRVRVEVRRGDGSSDEGTRDEAPAGRVRLGVRIEPLSADMAAALGSPTAKGVLVLEAMADTPALRAGFKAGDVVTRVGSTAVTTPDELVRAIAAVDGKVTVTVLRKGVRKDLSVDLGTRPVVDGSARDREDRDVRVEVRPRSRGERGFREPAPRVRVYEMRTRDGDDEDGADLRAEVEQLKRELRELRRELQDRK